MEDNIKPIDTDAGVSQHHAINSAVTLQSLCCKVLVMKEKNDLFQYKKEKLFYNEINKDNNPDNTNILSNNLDADKISQNIPEMLNCDFHSANLNKDINTQQWIDINEFDKFIHELKDNDPFTNLENDLPELDRYDFVKVEVDNTRTKSTTKKDFVSHSGDFENKRVNDILNITKAEPNEKGIIILGSSDNSDFEFSLPDDIDEISLSSLEAYENSIHDNTKSKVTIEISPQIQFITNFNNTKDTYQETNTILHNSSCSKSDTEESNEILSISTNNTKDLDDSFCSGYNSADFEIITEEEAITDGVIINYIKNKDVFNNETCRTVEVKAYKANSYQYSQASNNTEDYRNNYQIPEGDNFVDLFRGIFAPTTHGLYENKSMGLLENSEYAGLGFDIGVLSRQIREYQPDDEYKEEAEESTKKILNMYPRENRKRRRRFC